MSYAEVVSHNTQNGDTFIIPEPDYVICTVQGNTYSEADFKLSSYEIERGDHYMEYIGRKKIPKQKKKEDPKKKKKQKKWEENWEKKNLKR